MNIRRLGVLFRKDLIYGSRNVIFVFALVMPLVLSLVMGLLFGTLFNEKPKLGIVDEGSSQLLSALQSTDFLIVQQYASEDALLTELASGAVEMGLILPPDFDASLQDTTASDVTFYVWGQSLLKNRAIISAAVMDQLVSLTGRETPIEVNTVAVGDREAVSWQARLLPLVVLMSVVIGGVMVPATSMVEEKQHRTLRALTTTPMTMAEVFLTKGLMGVLLAIFSGIAILTLNGGWGTQPGLLLLVLTLAGMLASSFGIFLGARVKDITTLFATIKSIGILLYAPGIVNLFPDVIPQWVARIFPTYYIMQPVLDISQKGAGIGDIAFDLFVLVLMNVLFIVALGMVAGRLQVQEA
jgi:ABC-2 type transport system permease protein